MRSVDLPGWVRAEALASAERSLVSPRRVGDVRVTAGAEVVYTLDGVESYHGVVTPGRRVALVRDFVTEAEVARRADQLRAGEWALTYWHEPEVPPEVSFARRVADLAAAYGPVPRARWTVELHEPEDYTPPAEPRAWHL